MRKAHLYLKVLFVVSLLMCCFACAFAESSAEISTITSIELDADEIVLGNKQKTQVIATVFPEDALSKKLTWASSDTKIAQVSRDGIITGVGIGTATVSCSSADNSEISAVVQVRVFQPVQGLKLSNNKMTAYVGKTSEAIAFTIVPEDAEFTTVTWSSSDDSIATVNEKGEVTGITQGNVKITATSNEPQGMNGKAKTVVCNVKVDQAVDSIVLDVSEINIGLNSRFKPLVTIAPEDATNKKVKWSSDDPKVASVSDYGEIRGSGVGKTVVRCEAADGNGSSSEILVTVFQPVQSLKLDKGKMEAFVGKTSEALIVTMNPDNAEYKSVHWTSSDETIATVNENGEITGIAPGKVKITATSDEPVSANGKPKEAICQVTVIQPVLDIVLEPDIEKSTSKKIVLKATVIPDNATNQRIKWTSSNSNVAAVNNGTVTPKSDGGTVTITVSALDGSGIETSCEVNCYFHGTMVMIGSRVWKEGENVIEFVQGSVRSNSAALQMSITEDDMAEFIAPKVVEGAIDKRMSVVTFGHYEQDGFSEDGKELVEWLILDYNAKKQTVRLISKDILDGHYYNNSFPYPKWEDSDLNKWLNSDFMKEVFTDKEIEVIIPQENGLLLNILNADEANSLFDSNDERVAECTYYAKAKGIHSIWWIKHEYEKDSNQYWVGDPGRVKSGYPSGEAYTYDFYGVRPVIVLSIDSFD